MQHGLYFEDFTLGRTFTTDRRTITETDLVNFVNQHSYFEPLFMDREFVETQTSFKQQIAPALLTVSSADGLSIITGIMHKTAMALLKLDIDVKAPVFIGDTILVEIEVLERRETKKKDRGIVTFFHKVVNQNGETAIEYKVTRMIQRRPS